MFNTKSNVKKNLYFIITILFSIVASFSSVQGLISWITGAILMLIVFRNKFFSSFSPVIWIIIGIFTWIFYFYDYVHPTSSPSITSAFGNPVHLLLFFFSLIGDTVMIGTFGYWTVCATGISICMYLFIMCIALWRNRKQVEQYLFPIALIINSLFTTGSIAIGRSTTLLKGESRYTSFAIYIVIGLVLIWMQLKDNGKKTIIKKMAKMLMIVLIVSIPVIMIKSVHYGNAYAMTQKYHAYIVETADIQPKLSIDHLWSNLTEKETCKSIKFLKKHKYNVFHKPSYEIPPILFNDSLGCVNNDVLCLPENMIQLTSDYVKVITPAISPDYEDKITNLYIDLDGQIYPLYYNKNKLATYIPWIKKITYYPDTYGESLIASDKITGIHHAKIKSLITDGSYYITNVNVTNVTLDRVGKNY
jgi:hypothetical protein